MLKFGHNMSADKCFMRTDFAGARPGNQVTAILETENRQQVNKLEPVYFGGTDTDKKSL